MHRLGEAEQAQLAVAVPQQRSERRQHGAAAWRVAAEEQHVDVPLGRPRPTMLGTPPSGSRSASTPRRRSASTPLALMSNTSGAGRQKLSPMKNHGVPRLFGADRDAHRGGGVELGVAAAMEEEELVRRDDEVDDVGVGGQAVGDQPGLAADERCGLDEPAGDVGHEGVAGGGDVDLDRLHRLRVRRRGGDRAVQLARCPRRLGHGPDWRCCPSPAPDGSRRRSPAAAACRLRAAGSSAAISRSSWRRCSDSRCNSSSRSSIDPLIGAEGTDPPITKRTDGRPERSTTSLGQPWP